jgi:hypothetical protein
MKNRDLPSLASLGWEGVKLEDGSGEEIGRWAGEDATGAASGASLTFAAICAN